MNNAADHGRWFNPSVRPELPDRERAVSIAEELGRERLLLPELSGGFGYGAPHLAGTHLAITEQGQRSEHRLDVQVVCPVQVAGLPVIGGGGGFTLALGDGGDLIGYSGVWRGAEGAFDAALVPRERADDAHRALFSAAKGPGARGGPATARIGERSVPLRAVTLPATDFGPRVQLPPLAPAPKGAQPTTTPSA